MDAASDAGFLFHRLNNQLGIILAHAELLEAKVTDDNLRARATQVLSSTLEAMATVKELRGHFGPGDASEPPTSRLRS